MFSDREKLIEEALNKKLPLFSNSLITICAGPWELFPSARRVKPSLNGLKRSVSIPEALIPKVSPNLNFVFEKTQ